MAATRPDFTLPSNLPSELPVLSLVRGVLLPGAIANFTVGRAVSQHALDAAQAGLVLVVPQRDPLRRPAPSDLLSTGTLARIVSEKTQDGRRTVVTQGLARVRLTGFPSVRPYFSATFGLVEETWPDTVEAEAMEHLLIETVEEAADLLGLGERIGSWRKDLPTAGLKIDAVAGLLEAPSDWKRQVLSTHDPMTRAELVLAQLVRVRDVLSARRAIRDRLADEHRDLKKEAILRQQLAAIKKELGEDDPEDELSRLRSRLDDAELPDRVRSSVDRELKRLERLNSASPERSVTLDWLEWIAQMPWNTTSSVDVDLDGLETALSRSHHGLEDVKRQVVEHLAVRKLSGTGRADVLLLVGPPGVGKTSIAEAVSNATGRSLVRVALGGLRDEAELRGHRRTYIGARPGRLVEGIRTGGTADPVILLDEVDKLSVGMMGNPAAALLEILDPEQNHAFVDRYLEVPYDLSRALFIATANDLSTIPRPLLDRMDVLHIAGYTPAEKEVIARGHLFETVARNAGLDPSDVELTDDALRALISGWTREAGVRGLQRQLGRLFRAAAVLKARGSWSAPLRIDVDDLPGYLKRQRFKAERHDEVDQPGIATGLAWTPVGGSVLYIEASTMPGTGRLVLTGQLGDVMKESARAALTYVLAKAPSLGLESDVLRDRDVHIHVPAGAVPKDGPSAGVTMTTALASLLTGRRMRSDTAMTGEATLRGRVLPVGGIKSKVLGAHQRGIRRVILPRGNEADLEDVPDSVRDVMTFILVDHLEDVLESSLESVEALPIASAA